MPEPDYQWPSATLPVPASYATGSAAATARAIDDVERAFSERYATPVVFVPSGRAALALALQLHGVNRSQTVFAPKWSSHCVWNVVGRYANPTTTYDTGVDVALAVYKFARVTPIATDTARPAVIEDSCDSLVRAPAALFPNRGTYEIVSLPKVMGTYGGGLLICATDAAAARARDVAARTHARDGDQGRARWAIARGAHEVYDAWDAREYRNVIPDFALATHVADHLDAFDRNAATIVARIDRLSATAPEVFPSLLDVATRTRLPPVVPAHGADAGPDVMVRVLDVARSFEHPAFVRLPLMPLHFGVDDARFESLLAILTRTDSP